jgi:transposase
MKHTLKSNKFSTLVPKLYETGPNEAKFDINVFKMKSEKPGYLISNQLENLYNKTPMRLMLKNLKRVEIPSEFYIRECPQQNNLWISNDRNNYFPVPFLKLNLFQTLRQGLISIDRDLPNWYTESAEMKFRKLWLPLKTELPDSVTNCSNYYVKNITVPSWFTVMELPRVNQIQNPNLKMISYPLLTSSLRVTTEKEVPSLEKKEEISPTGILKVRLYPNLSQKKKLKLMMAANRFSWNLLVEKTKNKLYNIKISEFDKKYRKYVKKKNINPKMSIYKAPEECFDSSYRDFLKARKTNLAASKSKKDRTGKGFVVPSALKFRTKKSQKGSIEIRGRSLKYFARSRTIKIFPKFFGKKSEIKIKTDLRFLKGSFDYSCRLQMNQDRYYLLVPYVRENIPKVVGNRKCAIDPGSRTFLTGYESDGMSFEISNNNYHILRKQKHIQTLQRKIEKETNAGCKIKYRKIINNTYHRVSNCISDLHHKASKILSDTYKEILLPSFETSKMVSSKNRKISPGTSHNLLTFSHYKFRNLLQNKMDQRKGKLIICTEEYTSKTCGRCGRLNHKLGARKEFICPYIDCKIVIDRDINAARNIFIKNYDIFTIT